MADEVTVDQVMDGVVGGGGSNLMTPSEVAGMFRVDPKTVSRWAKAGRISCIRTPGGHRRFLRSEVQALLKKPSEKPEQPVPDADQPAA